MKELFIKLIKTLFFNLIGCFILCKSYMYMDTHDDESFLIDILLVILFGLGVSFIKVDYLKHTDKKIADAAISLFLYAVKRKQGTIEEYEAGEKLLKDSPIGEAVKEFINYEEEEKGEKNYD